MEIVKNPEIIATVTTKNQITIPKSIRQKLNIHSHDKIAFVIEANGVVTVSKSPDTSDLWDLVEEQQEKYGVLGETEIGWGEDTGSEVIDS